MYCTIITCRNLKVWSPHTCSSRAARRAGWAPVGPTIPGWRARTGCGRWWYPSSLDETNPNLRDSSGWEVMSDSFVAHHLLISRWPALTPELEPPRHFPSLQLQMTACRLIWPPPRFWWFIMAFLCHLIYLQGNSPTTACWLGKKGHLWSSEDAQWLIYPLTFTHMPLSYAVKCSGSSMTYWVCCFHSPWIHKSLLHPVVNSFFLFAVLYCSWSLSHHATWNLDDSITTVWKHVKIRSICRSTF